MGIDVLIIADPKDMNLHVRRATILDELNEKDLALEEMRASMKLDGTADDFGSLAEGFLGHGEKDLARRAAGIARVKEPSNERWRRLSEEISGATKP